MSYSSVEKYGPVSNVTEEDVEATHRFLHDTSFEKLGDWNEEHTEVHYVGSVTRPYRMLVDRRSQSEAVVVMGEFGNGIAPHAAARARVIRDIVSPDASLLMQTNAAFGQLDNMNFSLSERATLRRGLLLPMRHRLDNSLANLGDPDSLLLYGPSQGGTVALDYASTLDTPRAVVALEAPNVISRSRVELARDFLGCGGLLKEVMRENYAGDEVLEAEELFAPVLSLQAMARFVAGLPHPDNLAMIDAMRVDTAAQQMDVITANGGSVVHAYALGDKVSPVEENDKIAASMDYATRYRSVKLEGDHSVTNNIALGAALARTAHQLLSTAV